ncbi:PAS domain-containing sensor histidine kinase [Prosthecobacter fluviatilis]|uniref:histidine kinase n=1 Tax=Prosthecobacter fluviatilis TaxID=445931 RepID=A0ABW0KJZ9_9BACT
MPRPTSRPSDSAGSTRVKKRNGIAGRGRKPVSGTLPAKDKRSHKAKEGALTTTDLRFRMLMDHAPVLVWVSDPRKKRTWFNRPWLDFTGRTAQQEIGDGWEEGVHPEDLERCLAICAASFDERMPFEMTYRLRRHDGEYRWLLDKGVPLQDPGRQFIGYIGSCVDITDRKAAEAAVRAKEMQLRMITDNTPVMLIQCSRDLRYTFVNRAYADMLGLEPEEIIGRPIIDVLGKKAFRIIRPKITRVLSGRRVEYEEVMPYPRSGRRTVHVIYVPDTNILGQTTGWLASINDITDRRQIEDELHRERVFLRQVIDATPSMIFVKDSQGRFLLGNAALAHSCSTTVEKLVGRTDADFHRTSDQIAHFKQIDQEVMSSGTTLRIPEEEITQADGQVRWFSTGKVPLFNDAGICDKVLGVATDITEQRQTQKELERRVAERTAELRAQMDERNRLENALLDISEQEQRRLGQDLHDGLCQSLSGLAFMARSLTKTLEAQALAGPAAEAARLADLIHQSVEQSRNIAKGLHPVVMDAEGLVSALHELAARSSGSISCRLRCEQMVPITDNDVALHLYRIAQEAVTNALKHSGARSITLSLRLRQGLLSLSVADDGCGLPEVIHAGDGMGLRLMKYRADVIGADFAIGKRKTHGTRMTCLLRMPAASHSQLSFLPNLHPQNER